MREEHLLYDLRDSPFCMKARICLHLKGVSYRTVTVTARRYRELRRLNPLGKVPVLVHDGEVIADSSSIARRARTVSSWRNGPTRRSTSSSARSSG